MDTITETRKTTVRKAPLRKKAAAVDPFAEAVDVTPVEKAPARRTSARVKKESTIAAEEVKAVKRVVRRSSKTITLDPFAAIAEKAEPTSPVKKRAVKARSAKAETSEVKPRKAVAATAKKTVVDLVPAAPKKKSTKALEPTLDATAEIATTEPKIELSPVFKALADVSLPELQRENRARLQMQTPTRLYLYWSVKENPWALLRDVFGDDLGSYTLVLKLIDNKNGYEKLVPTDAEGNYWFDVEPDGSYKAEIGFYATNRPYFRIMHSNTIETPRRSPSPRAATDADWRVSANKFAEVLDVAGFTRDAFDVAMAGDDYAASTDASHVAFASFLGRSESVTPGISAEDIRYAMLALAAGVKLEDLRWRIGETLFAVLSANADKLEAGRAKQALTEHFDIDDADFEEETQLGPAVFGASLVNFPRTLTTRTVTAKGQFSPQYIPVSSHSFR